MYNIILKINNKILTHNLYEIDFYNITEKFVGFIRREEIKQDKKYGYFLKINYSIFFNNSLELFARQIVFSKDYRKYKKEAIEFIRFYAWMIF